MSWIGCALGLSIALAAPPVPPPAPSPPPPPTDLYVKDVDFALAELEKRCGHFFATKKVDWEAVEREFRGAAKKAKSDSDHMLLLVRLLARVRDGHSALIPLEKGKKVKAPPELEAQRSEPPLQLCRNGDTILVKDSWGDARRAGFVPGCTVSKIDGKPALEWLAACTEEIRDLKSFSTDRHAETFTLLRGLAGVRGTRHELEIANPKGAKKKLSLNVTNDEGRSGGPAVPPADAKPVAGLQVGKTVAGFGWIRVPAIDAGLPEALDQALAQLGEVEGLVLDLRGNKGGGYDEPALLGRFVAKGAEYDPKKSSPWKSAGANPFAGNLVVIVDAMVVSAGETFAGTFSEDGRGYVIGESWTAGMSGSKEEIALPSGLFALRVVVHSNKARFNKGKGIEGIGVEPHEVIPYSADDLAKGVDTLLRRADELLAKWPQDRVAYKAPR